jgi:signal transduction histidine kinase
MFQWRPAKDNGTGIGPAIRKKTVMHLSGCILVESATCDESSFFFTLPQTQPFASRP